MPGQIALDFAHATLLQGTSALNVKAGVVGNPGGAGVAGDSLLLGVYILLNAAAVTLTIGGMNDNTGAAANMVLTGQVTIDTWYAFPAGWRNEFGPLIVTPSVAAKVWLFTRAYVGP